MKGLFCFDGPMYCDVDGTYCNTTLTNQVFDRYLNVVDNLTIAIRTFHLDKSFEDEHLHEIKLKNLKIVECPNLNSVNGMIFERNKTYTKLYKLVKESDLIFARMPSIISNMVISIAIRLKKPYLVEVGGCVWDSYWNHGLIGKAIAPYLFVQTRKMINNAPFAVYVTQEFLQRRYPNSGKTAVCSNVILPKFDNEILQKRLKKIQNKRPDMPKVIGTTAAINVRYKGQEYIIEAIAKLNKQGYNFEYELVGGGEKDYLESVAVKYGVVDKVRFLGVMLHADVIKWLDSIDIYAQPSKQEGLPRALVEAMSRGIPAVGSTTAGIPELLSENVVFSNGNIKTICSILSTFDTNNMINLSILNFEKAKEFDSELIESRRQECFKKYANYVINYN